MAGSRGDNARRPPHHGHHAAEPDRFDLHRPDADRHLAFGKGLHFCLGVNLGRLGAQIAIAELARRYPNLALAPDQEFTFHPNISFRGPQVLKVRTN
jgi:cytochrome P450